MADEVLESMNTDADHDGIQERQGRLQHVEEHIDALLPEHVRTERAKADRKARWAVNINVIANIILLVAKGVAALKSSSLSLIASLLDSALDLLCTVIVWTTNRLVSWRLSALARKFPVGRRRLEPIGILVFSIIMVISFLQILQESVSKLLPSGDHSIATLPALAIGSMAGTVVIKGIIGVGCYPIKTTQVQALVQDCKTDVYFNTLSLLFPLIGKHAGVWWLDPLGAALLSLYIIYDWADTCLENVTRLCGLAVDDTLQKKLVYMAYRFSNIVAGFKSVTAYHAGDGVWAEFDILLDEKTPLRRTHDIAETLQYCCEALTEVDRAFVTTDCKFVHNKAHDRTDGNSQTRCIIPEDILMMPHKRCARMKKQSGRTVHALFTAEVAARQRSAEARFGAIDVIDNHRFIHASIHLPSNIVARSALHRLLALTVTIVMPLFSGSRLSRDGGVAKISQVKRKPLAQSKSRSQTSRNNDVESVNELQKPADSSPAKRQATTPRKKKKKGPDEETRLRRYRGQPPASFLVKLERAQTQRMIVVGRTRKTIADAPAEDIDIVGSTGNIYTVTISHLPSCTCPDSLKGNECKHKVYALHTVLKAPSHLQYQLALLTSELQKIFSDAPPIPTAVAEDLNGRRKPTDGECPICYMELDEESNELVWCKAQCGHNLHKSCFDQWAKSQGAREVRCVYCRTPWETDARELAELKRNGEQGEDGYINVAEVLGMSRARDYSGYYQPWARRRFGVGW
jgi:divalent metal cation (Fe/Co/Zn/Cd) transporter